MTDEFITFGRPDIRQREIDEVVDTLKSGWIGMGYKVKKFENQFKAYIGCKEAIATNSCTSALFLSLKALGIGEGGEVITSPMSFVATTSVIEHVGAIPVFADVLPDGNINPKDAKLRITEKTKAIVPVHLYGNPCDVSNVQALAHQNKLKVVWDCAHAAEARYNGESVGRFPDLCCFSFYTTKNLTTAQGGMVTTADSQMAEEIRLMSNHGMTKDAWKRHTSKTFIPYDIVCLGYNMIMTDLEASIGLHQLARLEENLKRREEICRRYDREMVHAEEDYPKHKRHARHLYTVPLPLSDLRCTRDEFVDQMQQNGVGCGVHYNPIHLMKYYRKKYGYKEGDYPCAEYLGERTVSLPLSTNLTDEEVTQVIRTFNEVYEKCAL